MPSLTRAALAVAVLAPLVSHGALALGRGYDVALGLSAVQAVAAGLVLSRTMARARWWGGVVAAVLLVGMAAGGARSAETGVLVGAGLAHALLYGALLAVFARSLWPGRISVVTRMAARMNPTFHAGMVPYTRVVAWAWCGFFAAQLVASAVLLAMAPELWRALVTTVHAPLVLLMALAEFLVRRWRFRHEHYTGFWATIRGARQAMVTAPPPDAGTSTRSADYRGHSGNGTRRPPPGRSSAPGQGG